MALGEARVGVAVGRRHALGGRLEVLPRGPPRGPRLRQRKGENKLGRTSRPRNAPPPPPLPPPHPSCSTSRCLTPHRLHLAASSLHPLCPTLHGSQPSLLPPFACRTLPLNSPACPCLLHRPRPPAHTMLPPLEILLAHVPHKSCAPSLLCPPPPRTSHSVGVGLLVVQCPSFKLAPGNKERNVREEGSQRGSKSVRPGSD